MSKWQYVILLHHLMLLDVFLYSVHTTTNQVRARPWQPPASSWWKYQVTQYCKWLDASLNIHLVLFRLFRYHLGRPCCHEHRLCLPAAICFTDKVLEEAGGKVEGGNLYALTCLLAGLGGEHKLERNTCRGHVTSLSDVTTSRRSSRRKICHSFREIRERTRVGLQWRSSDTSSAPFVLEGRSYISANWLAEKGRLHSTNTWE